MLEVQDILDFHKRIAQDFPIVQQVDEKKLNKFLKECYALYNEQGVKDCFTLSACICSKIVIEKPFHNANKKTAILCVGSLLENEGYELVASFNELTDLLEDIADSKMTLKQLALRFKQISAHL